jgi:acetyltransferase-like isoleucine patch superfamily enzyme
MLNEDVTGEWDYTTLPDNIRLGKHCFLARKASFARFRSTRRPGLVIGDRVHVHTSTTFNVEPQGWVAIGSDTILAGAVFMCAEHIRVGAHVVISYNVTIADSDFHPLDPASRRLDAIANAPAGDRSRRPRIESEAVEIGDYAWIGIGAIILKGATIGRGARVGAGAVVTADVPDGVTVEGNPARRVRSGE